MAAELSVQPKEGFLPATIERAGHGAAKRFLEFFTVNIRNPNTRHAYTRAIVEFFTWCEKRGLEELARVEPTHVAARVESCLKNGNSKPIVKQKLAAVRMLFDWLAVGQVVPSNPASVVREPKYTIKKGKTAVLAAKESRALLNVIKTKTLVGLRDRALVATTAYTFARMGR